MGESSPVCARSVPFVPVPKTLRRPEAVRLSNQADLERPRDAQTF